MKIGRLSRTIGLATAAFAALLLIGLSPAHFAYADHVPSGQYFGITSDFGAIEFTVNAAGTAAENIKFSPLASSVATTCPPNATIDSAPITNHSVSASALPGNAGQRNVGVTINFAPGGVATGSFTVDPPLATTCPSRRVTFAAVAPTGPLVAPAPGASYTGAASFGGTVSFTIAGDGKTMQGLKLDLMRGDCNYSIRSVSAITNAIDTDGSFNLSIAEPGNPADRLDVLGGFSSSSTGAGAIVAGTSDPGCANLVGTFTVTTPGAGTITTGSIPRAGGFGLIVFGGGSNDELVAASGCSRATVAFWATDASGAFVPFVPGSTVAIVNQGWNNMFSAGIPAGTPLVAKCV